MRREELPGKFRIVLSNMMHHPGNIRHLGNERNHEVDQPPIGDRFVADVLVEPFKARLILAKRAQSGLSSIISQVRRVDEEIQTQPNEVTVYRRKSRWTSSPQDAVGNASGLTALYKRENGYTFGMMVDRIIESTMDDADPNDRDSLFNVSRMIFNDIFTLLSLVDRKKVGFDEAASAVVQSLSRYPFGYFSYGEVIDGIESSSIPTPIKTDKKTATKFKDVYMRDADKEQRVAFANGMLEGQLYWLNTDPFRSVIIPFEKDALSYLDERRKRVVKQNAKSKAAKTLPIMLHERSQNETVKQRMARHFSPQGGLELWHEDISRIYADRNSRFTDYIDDTIDRVLENIGLQQNPNPIAEYVHMFGRFFDYLTLLQPNIAGFDAGAAFIIDRLYGYNFNATLIGESINHIIHLQYPTGEFYRTGDRSSALKFVDVFLRIMPENERNEFQNAINNNRYNMNVTRASAEQLLPGITMLIGDKGIPYTGHSAN